MIGGAADAVGDPAWAARAAVDDQVRAAARWRPLLKSRDSDVSDVSAGRRSNSV